MSSVSNLEQRKHVDVLIVGKTGNGKSATGNSILFRNFFKRSGNATSETSKIKYEYSKYKDRKIKVVDSPGIGENRYTNEEAVKLITKALKKAIISNPKGYHAFLIVIKYGNRFTGEEQCTIDFLKQFFGPNFVRDYCILVMSCGDNFLTDLEDTKETFDSWCEQQTGTMGELLKECGNRIVLFDNNTKDQKIKEHQLDKLLCLIDQLSSGGRRYTDNHFEEAKQARDSILVQAKQYVIKEKTDRKTSLMFQKLEQIQKCNDTTLNDKKIHKLKLKCEKLIRDISAEDKGTGVLHELLDSIKSLNTTINNEIQFNERLKKEKEESKRIEKELKQHYEDKNDTLQRQLDETRKTLIKQREEIEEIYRAIREESTSIFLLRAADWITTPARKVIALMTRKKEYF